MEVEGLKPGCESLTSPTYPQAVDNPHTWTPAQPGDTPGQVEPDDSRPKPMNAADPLDEDTIDRAASAAFKAVWESGDGKALALDRDDWRIAVRAAAPIIAAPIQARLESAESDLLDHAADFRNALADLTAERDEARAKLIAAVEALSAADRAEAGE